MIIDILVVGALLYTMRGACRYARKHIDASSIGRRN